LNQEASEISANYIRIDAQGIDPGLLQFMDRKYPFGSVPAPALYPNQG
jgi:hypothetical protein